MAVSAGHLCSNNSTNISLIQKSDKCTTIVCLHHPPTGPFIWAFFPKVVTPGHEKKKASFCHPLSSYDEQIVRQELFTGETKKQETMLKNGLRS